MNSVAAAHSTVHDFKPGGSETLGPLVGISPAVLRNKVNPNNDTHHLTFAEARKIADMTGDYRMLQAWAHEAGFLLVKAPEGTNECDMSVLESVMETGVAHGRFMQSIHAALSDGKVDDKEVEAIAEAERALQTAAATTTRRMKGMAG